MAKATLVTLILMGMLVDGGKSTSTAVPPFGLGLSSTIRWREYNVLKSLIGRIGRVLNCNEMLVLLKFIAVVTMDMELHTREETSTDSVTLFVKMAK